jgi:hypothetical protein
LKAEVGDWQEVGGKWSGKLIKKKIKKMLPHKNKSVAAIYCNSCISGTGYSFSATHTFLSDPIADNKRLINNLRFV